MGCPTFGFDGDTQRALSGDSLMAFSRFAIDQKTIIRLSLLVFANVATVAGMVASGKGERARELFAAPLTWSALAVSLLVAPFLIFGGWMTTSQIAARMLWLAAIWLVISWLRGWPILFAAFQLALASAVTFSVAALFGHQWPQSFVSDLRTLQAQAIALALLSLAWIGVRLILGKVGSSAMAARLLRPAWPAVDRVVTLLSLAFLVGLSLYGASVGMIEGLFQWRALSAEGGNLGAMARGSGSWLLPLALALVFIVGLWERFEKRAALAMLILLACASLLVAGQWRNSGLTPVIYRWSSAIAFAFVSLVVVSRARVAPALRRFGWPGNPLFIPEAILGPQSAVNAFYAIGQHDAIGFSPFSIESTAEPTRNLLAEGYDVLAQLAPLILARQGKNEMAGFLPEGPEQRLPQQARLGGYTLNVTYERPSAPAPQGAQISEAVSGGLAIAVAPDEFIIAGTGLVVTFEANSPGLPLVGILSVQEGKYVEGQWRPRRWLNGDQTHQGRHLRLPPGKFDIQRIKLYRYR